MFPESLMQVVAPGRIRASVIPLGNEWKVLGSVASPVFANVCRRQKVPLRLSLFNGPQPKRTRAETGNLNPMDRFETPKRSLKTVAAAQRLLSINVSSLQ